MRLKKYLKKYNCLLATLSCLWFNHCGDSQVSVMDPEGDQNPQLGAEDPNEIPEPDAEAPDPQDEDGQDPQEDPQDGDEKPKPKPKPFDHDHLIQDFVNAQNPQPDPEPDPDPIPDPVPSDHFIDQLIKLTPGQGAGFGQDKLPDIIMGPPQGAGDLQGGKHVLALGRGGEIIVASETPVLDGEGIDFIVFENAFFAGGNPNNVFMEMGKVSVSQDGVTFYDFPCNQQTGVGCAGVHPVYANSLKNNIDPLDFATAGGDPFDLEDLNLKWIRYVKIKDVSGNGCQPVCSNGFDLDAMAFIYQ